MRTTIRHHWLAAALLLAGGPADAGMRALYEGEGNPKTMLVEVADNGDFRIGEPDAPSYGLGLGGAFFLVAPSPDGAPEVIRIEDMAAALDEVLPPAFKALFGAAGATARPARPPTLRKVGSRKVAGQAGEVWQVTAGDPPQTREMVFSRAPELAPVGAAIVRFMESTMLMAAPLFGPAAADMVKEMRAVFSVGAPLDGGGLFRLVKAEAADIPTERLRLPAEPLAPAKLVERLKASARPPAN
ncbi:MAG: hypothetical protein ACK4Z0_09710 [Sphingomonadaceae bacterium]